MSILQITKPYVYKGITKDNKTIYSNIWQRPSLMYSSQDNSWHEVKEVRTLSPYKDKNGIVVYNNDTLIYNNALFILLYNEKLEEYVIENVQTKEQISAYHISPEDIEVENKALFYDIHGIPVYFDKILRECERAVYYMLRLETTTNTPILVKMRPSLDIEIATQERILQMEVKSL